MLKSLRTARLGALAAVAAGAIVLATGAALATVYQTIPFEPRTTPEPALTSEPRVVVPPPAPLQPPYVVSEDVAGRVLHWTQTSRGFSPNSPDSANGKVLQGELWVRIGDDGLPIEVHALYTLPDGAFYQELVQNRATDTVILDPINAAASRAGCRMQGASSAESMRLVLPLFVDERELAGNGFTRVLGATLQSPPPSLPVGFAPRAVHRPDVRARVWERHRSTQGIATFERLKVGARGRVQAATTVSTDAIGVVIGESATVYGALEEYAPVDVPPSQFAFSQRAQEVCRG